jgi:ketosteroid isomerase-like protein
MNRECEVALAAIRAVEERDAETLFGLCHVEVEFHEAPTLPYGGSSRGKEFVRRQLDEEPERTWLGTWEPLQQTVRERRMDPRVIATDGETVVIMYRQRAVAASGERLDAPVLCLYHVRDGKLARAQLFHFDTAAIMPLPGGGTRVRAPKAGDAASVRSQGPA